MSPLNKNHSTSKTTTSKAAVPSAELTKGGHRYVLMNPLPKHFLQIQELCKRVYPFSRPWSLEQLESHRSYFPDGQLIILDKKTGKVMGLAFSLIIDWNDYSPQDNWQDFTSGGFFHNHNPKKGKTLYGAEVMVDPECRGQGLGKMLYQGRRKIAEKYGLKRIRAGARLRGYSKFSEKLSPDDYTIQVVEKKIYDPTLSFQLSQGFKVIDVAPSYLYNDPESLGHAAVIEWLNPKTTNARDIEKQKRSIEHFMSGEKFVPEFLPKELRRLVRKATVSLGKTILELEGGTFYRRVEFYREQLKKTRNKKHQRAQLQFLFKELAQEKSEDLMKITHAFSLLLEIINVCEASYRTWRQRQKGPPVAMKNKLHLTYVLTAHPTEARSKEMVEILAGIGRLLVEGIHQNFYFNENALLTQMKMLWLHPLSKTKRPTVLDEAEYIYSLIFAPDIFNFILSERPGHDLKLRTWVGGDKDGHPGVDKEVMRQCLELSRQHLVHFVSLKLKTIIADLNVLAENHHFLHASIKSLHEFEVQVKKFRQLGHGDGTKIKTWKVKYQSFLKQAHSFVQKHEQTILLVRLLELFPALVLPIELREDAALIGEALTDTHSPIRGMLVELGKISGVLDVCQYARGLVISHCESAEDMTRACQLVELCCKEKTLPVIPLFESGAALSGSKKILRKWLAQRANHDLAKRHWHNKFEVMLGYSDSAKEVGVLRGRVLMAKAMEEIEKVVKGQRLVPIFFHGSGGSVARGGGSLKEQIAWWGQAAIENPKMTIQGEMIQRLFTTKEILNSQCAHFTAEAQRKKVRKMSKQIFPELDLFSQRVEREYRKLVSNSPLLMHLLSATPYLYLDALKIGSRPSKRPELQGGLSSLRAIPWVLCWTQTRVLLPTWWGIGRSWKKLPADQREKLKAHYQENLFFSSFIKTLGYTLAKVELDLWELYFPPHRQVSFLKTARAEFQQAVDFVQEISGQKQLLWYRPWLEESIRLRSPHIHILNMAQILAMQNGQESLLRETLVGIACGMLTTG